MIISASVKGQLTKIVNSFTLPDGEVTDYADSGHSAFHSKLRAVFEKHMPREQAKHAVRKYLLAHKQLHQ